MQARPLPEAASTFDAGLADCLFSLVMQTPLSLLFSQTRPPMVCAHGGDSAQAPPNTAAAFRAAIDAGADCVEVRLLVQFEFRLHMVHTTGMPVSCCKNGRTSIWTSSGSSSLTLTVSLWHTCLQIDVARSKDGELVVLHVRELQQLLGTRATPDIQVWSGCGHPPPPPHTHTHIHNAGMHTPHH